MTNVLLYNLFFDVPVKLFAANLLAALLFICLPDLRALYGFFWLHQPSAPAGIWVPPLRRKAFRIATRTIELAYTVAFLLIFPALTGYGWYKFSKAETAPTPLLGAWHLDPAHPASGAFLSPEHQPITDLYVDTSQRAFARSTDGELWRTHLKLDPTAHTVGITCEIGEPTLYRFQLPDPNHLILNTEPPPVRNPLDPRAKPDLKAKPAPAFIPATLTLTRIPVPQHYPLLDRGFHWVNEWGLER